MFEKIRRVIAEQMASDPEEITEDSSFKDDIGADSLDLFEITMALEEEFELDEIPADELGDIVTVKDLMEYLKTKGVQE